MANTDSYQPKWTHFHPQSIVWVQNILDHDVIYKVADEHNNVYTYRLKAGQINELPGGAIATLGVKSIVDELIQNSKEDILRIYEPAVRQKYQDEIVIRIKEAPSRESKTVSGEIDLSVGDGSGVDTEEEALPVLEKPVVEEAVEEVDFPALKDGSADLAAKKVAAATANALPESKTLEED